MVEIVDNIDEAVSNASSCSSIRGGYGVSVEGSDSMPSNAYEEEDVVTLQETSGSSSSEDDLNEDSRGSDDAHNFDIAAASESRDREGQGGGNPESVPISTCQSDLRGDALEPMILDVANLNIEADELRLHVNPNGGEQQGLAVGDAAIATRVQCNEVEGKDETLPHDIQESSRQVDPTAGREDLHEAHDAQEEMGCLVDSVTDGSTLESDPPSDHLEGTQEDVTMTDAWIAEESEEKEASPAAKGRALLDLDLLCSLLEHTKDAGDALDGQDVLLFIGGTGSGKTTSVLYFAGARFEEDETTGFSHYNPIEFPSDKLKGFKVDPGGRSVTQTICAARVQLPNGAEIALVDTPGFGDTNGAEYDIANGLGLVRALQRAKSIRPVLVFNAQLFGDRFRSLSETLDTVNRMMGGERVHVEFSKFRYLYTRCEGREVQRMHRKLSMFINSLSEQDGDSSKEQLLPLLQDMQRKANPVALAVDPLDFEGRIKVLFEVWNGEDASHALNASNFFPFLSLGVEEKLQGELERRLAALELDCRCGNFLLAQQNLFILRRLSVVLPEAADTMNRALSFFSLLLSRICETVLLRFKTLWQFDMDRRVELHNTLHEFRNEVENLLRVPEETLSLCSDSGLKQASTPTELFQEMRRTCPRIEASLSSNDIRPVQRILFLLNEVSKSVVEFSEGKTFSLAFSQALDRTLAHATSGIQDAQFCLATNKIEEILKMESPIVFASDLLSFLFAEDIAEAKGRAVLERDLRKVINQVQSRVNRSKEQVIALSRCLESSLDERREIDRHAITKVAKIVESRTFLIAVRQMKELGVRASITVDRSVVSDLDELVIKVLSGVPKVASKEIGKLEILLAESIAFDFEEQRKPLLRCADVVTDSLTLCQEIVQWPCIDVPGYLWEHLTSSKSKVLASIDKIDECAKRVERGLAEALQTATQLSRSLANADLDISASYIELFDHWEAWRSLLDSVNKSRDWYSSIKGSIKVLFRINSTKQNLLELEMRKILHQLHGLLKESVHRVLAVRESEPILLLQECPKEVCFILAFIQTPKASSLGSQILNSLRGSSEWFRRALRKISQSIEKINRLPSDLLSDHKYDCIDIFLLRLEEAREWVNRFRSLASRIVYSDCFVNEFASEHDLEMLIKSLFEVPTSEQVLEDVEKVVNDLSAKVKQLSLLRANRVNADHEREKFFQDVVSLVNACATVHSVSGHLKSDPNVAATLYQNLLKKIESDLGAFRDGLRTKTASFPDDQTSLSQINSHLSSLSSFDQCFADVKPRLATMACKILNECRSMVFQSLEQRLLSPLTTDCYEFASYLVVLKKSSREVSYWATEIDRFIDKTLNTRVAQSEQPASFLLDLSLALRRIDGDDAVVAEQLLWDHHKFQGVLASIFSEATAGQDISYVLDRLNLSPKQRQKLEELYAAFLDLYTNKVLDGVAAFRSRDQSLPNYLFSLVSEAKTVSKEGNTGFSESIVLLSSSLFAHWSLSNVSDLVLLENDSSLLSKYLMKPHAAQVVACWVMLNVHESDEFHALKHILLELGTGEGKSIILGVVATILAVWGYSVDVLCYSSYLSERDVKAFQNMFTDFGVDRWIWYGTLRGLSPRVIGHSYYDDARAVIENSVTANRLPVQSRPSVLLVDEVDVFFGADVFGSTFRQSCSFSVNSLESLMKAIWQRSASPESKESILNNPQVNQCLSELPSVLHPHFYRSIDAMQNDADSVRRGTGRQYHVVDDQIAYKYFDGVETDIYYGYETHFHYIKEWENGNITTAAMASLVQESLYKVALTSYAEYPFAFDITLGVTGTLRALTSEERRVLEDMYEIRSYYYIPSVFGRNKLVFAGDDEKDFKLCDTHGDHVFELKHELMSRRESTVGSQKVLRPVMIFFDCKDTLLKFHSSTLMEPLKDQVAVVTEATPTYEKDSLFLKATEAGAITLMIREFGRGTDFKCFDRRVLEAGGVHVIQAFFSKEFSEEIQIKGRCARQGAAGSYSLVLNVEDLQRGFGISKDDTESMRLRRELYSYVNKKRADARTEDLTERMNNVAAAEEVHYRTLACKEALEAGCNDATQRGEVVSFFNELNGLGASRSFIQSGLKESIIAARLRRYEQFKADDRKKRNKARETLLLEASVADKKRLETRERLKAETVSHYSVLGLDRDASTDDVKRAFRSLTVLFHPDKCKDDDATEIFRKLREAHDILSCDEKRAAYDAENA